MNHFNPAFANPSNGWNNQFGFPTPSGFQTPPPFWNPWQHFANPWAGTPWAGQGQCSGWQTPFGAMNPWQQPMWPTPHGFGTPWGSGNPYATASAGFPFAGWNTTPAWNPGYNPGFNTGPTQPAPFAGNGVFGPWNGTTPFMPGAPNYPHNYASTPANPYPPFAYGAPQPSNAPFQWQGTTPTHPNAHSQPGWTNPGGATNPNETAEPAAKRNGVGR